MSDDRLNLPPNVYRVAQRRFDAIPSAPWVYWLPERIRAIFESETRVSEHHSPCRGIQTSDNFRFIRFWWETGLQRVNRRLIDGDLVQKWFPYMKGGGFRKWYGNQECVLNWGNDGEELYAFRPYSVIRNADLMLEEGVTFSTITSGDIGFRYMPSGFFWDQAGSALIPNSHSAVSHLAILNSRLNAVLTKLVAPTINYTIGDIAKVPFRKPYAGFLADFYKYSSRCIWIELSFEQNSETTWDFINPIEWIDRCSHLRSSQNKLLRLEKIIDEKAYDFYGISDADRAAIEADLTGSVVRGDLDGGDKEADASVPKEELAAQWISYAVGIVLGRFRPGLPGGLGCAVYRKSDFAIGSLPEPDEAEFDQLVGEAERFAYIDEEGGRHVFPAAVEQALRELAVPDGIAVLDPGHPRDLPALVEKALRLMLDGKGAGSREHEAGGAADEVITIGARGDLRKFLEKDFFSKWHVKWYRKRPVCWWLQSAKRGYGFVLFHEKVEKYTLYVLLREYADHKINGLRLRIEDLEAGKAGKSGRALRQLEKEIDQTRKLLEEVSEFAKTMERIANDGYRPEENWIDDGVILRLAPLWELIPIWKAEPRKYWQRLQAGQYDWSHIAMRYWPERVRAACRANKSFAIAHGHEEWYQC